MNQLLAVLFLLISVFGYAQFSNPFANEKGDEPAVASGGSSAPEPPVHHYTETDALPADDDDPGDPPNPGDPVPIDDYLPLLLVVAGGMAVYAGYRKKWQNS